MKASKLQERLARSLDRANARGARGAPAGAILKPPPPAGGGCKKLSLSFFDENRRRVEEIRAAVLARTGRSPSTSECVRAALRAVDPAALPAAGGKVAK